MDGILKTEENQKNSRIDEIRIRNKNKRIARHIDGFFFYLVSLSKLNFNNTLCRAIQAREDFERTDRSRILQIKKLYEKYYLLK